MIIVTTKKNSIIHATWEEKKTATVPVKYNAVGPGQYANTYPGIVFSYLMYIDFMFDQKI